VLLVHELVPTTELRANHKAIENAHLFHRPIGVGQLHVRGLPYLVWPRAVPVFRVEYEVLRTTEANAGLQQADAAAQVLLGSVLHAIDHLEGVLRHQLRRNQHSTV